MIDRYTCAEMAQYWSDEHRYRTWFLIEKVAMKVNPDCPPGAETANWHCPSPQDVATAEKVTGHDVEAFIRCMTVGVTTNDTKWLHHKLTSSDIVDTGLALIVQSSLRLLYNRVDELKGKLDDKAYYHRRTRRIGRTHGQHAAPTTLGHQLGIYSAQLHAWRVRAETTLNLPGKLSGPVGNHVHGLTPEQEKEALTHLGLVEVLSGQSVPRYLLADVINSLAVLASIIESLALQIRLGSQTEIGEMAEGAAAGRVGSSSMPHKQNPIGCEKLAGLARIVRSYPGPVMESIATWGERDISNSSVERVIVPDAFNLTYYMVDAMLEIVNNLQVHGTRMQENLQNSDGWWTYAKTNAMIAGGHWTRAEARHRAKEDPSGAPGWGVNDIPYPVSWEKRIAKFDPKHKWAKEGW